MPTIVQGGWAAARPGAASAQQSAAVTADARAILTTVKFPIRPRTLRGRGARYQREVRTFLRV